MSINFEEFFSIAMGANKKPYPYQAKLASTPWPEMIKVETGMGKTAAIVINWLFKRLQKDSKTPRRLVYCLPMRVLVEQTVVNTKFWISNLVNAGVISAENRPLVNVLMGGDIDNDWDRFPERGAILIGTQDQLLSRALNRGYGLSRFRWPMQFGLLNNDCLWVMDEVQMMGAGLTTTAQLQAFRNIFGTEQAVYSVWMSATLNSDWLKTIDFKNYFNEQDVIELSEKDINTPSLQKRFRTKKRLSISKCKYNDFKKIADLILETHRNKTRTLVVVNTVSRAVNIYKAVKKRKSNQNIVLVHSRFRPPDRRQILEQMLAQPGTEGSICIATQVVEAGVDISAATLITDPAPWSSLVQRFGRCNRYGDDKNAKVVVLEMDAENKRAVLPYSTQEIENSLSTLSTLHDVAPENLPSVTTPVDQNYVIRKNDFMDLFDTTPDISGMDIDISRFIRDTKTTDVSVFWRCIQQDKPSDDEPAPVRDELCPVPVGDLKKAAGFDKWFWDHLDKQWRYVDSLCPGMVIMLRQSQGGYSTELGWTKNHRDIPVAVQSINRPEESNDDDLYSITEWQTVSGHTNKVVETLKYLLSMIPVIWTEPLLLAARWHDAGKSHEIFQAAILGDPPQNDPNIIWAKTSKKNINYSRKGFRHELASALAMLSHGLPDLAAYLAAAHHGKVRMSIRSLPTETTPPDSSVRFARGIWEGDTLRQTDLGDGVIMPETTMHLNYMDLGENAMGESWLARMTALRDDSCIGPFRISFYESILRVADWRASQHTGEEHE